MILLASRRMAEYAGRKIDRIRPNIFFIYVNFKNDAESIRKLKPRSANPRVTRSQMPPRPNVCHCLLGNENDSNFPARSFVSRDKRPPQGPELKQLKEGHEPGDLHPDEYSVKVLGREQIFQRDAVDGQ